MNKNTEHISNFLLFKKTDLDTKELAKPKKNKEYLEI